MKFTVLDAPPGMLSLGMTATVRFAPGGKKVALLPRDCPRRSRRRPRGPGSWRTDTLRCAP
ncbi:MAG: hypothetical protein WDN49_06835 [Acetobacteraceae bacterium]